MVADQDGEREGFVGNGGARVSHGGNVETLTLNPRDLGEECGIEEEKVAMKKEEKGSERESVRLKAVGRVYGNGWGMRIFRSEEARV